MEESLKRSDDTKAKLIDAAGHVFAQRGYPSTTVREICGRAGTPVGAVNYHFRNKQGLYVAVLEHSMQSAFAKYPLQYGIEGEATPEEKLRAFIHSFLLRILDEGVPAWHMKLVNQEISDPAGAFDHMMEACIRPTYEYLRGILCEMLEEENVEEGRESDLVFLCATSIAGQCLYHFMGRNVIAALRPESFNPADIGRIAEHITEFTLRGIRKPGEQGERHRKEAHGTASAR